MPVQVNPLLLQQLFFDMLDDLEATHNQLYSGEVAKQMNIYCLKKRMRYAQRFQELVQGGKPK